MQGMDWAVPDARVLFVCLCVCSQYLKIRAGESIVRRLGLVCRNVLPDLCCLIGLHVLHTAIAKLNAVMA